MSVCPLPSVRKRQSMWKARLAWVWAVCAASIIALIVCTPSLITGHAPGQTHLVELANAHRPPAIFATGLFTFPMGTDEQGRDLWSLLVYATRTSLLIAIATSVLAAVVGTVLGLMAGMLGRTTDIVVRRLAELQLTFPALLTALLLHASLQPISIGAKSPAVATAILIQAVSLAAWPEFALCTRAIARSELSSDYIAAARAIGQSRIGIMLTHLWPAVRGQVLVLMLWTAAHAITIEATLSFLGVGLPPQTPSLGRLIRDGQPGLLNGEWWVAGFPLIFVVGLIVALSLASDRLHNATTAER